MEKYNEREKEIIKQLVNYKDDFQDLKTFGRFLTEKIFPNDVHLITNVGGTNNIVFCKTDDKKRVVYYIAELSFLIHSLIKDGLLTPIPGNKCGTCYIGKIEGFDLKKGNNDQLDIYANGFKTNEYINTKDNYWYDNDNVKYDRFVFDETQIHYMDILNDCTLISPELEMLVRCNFNTVEQKTLRWTRIAAIISFCGMLSATIIPFLTSTKIDEEQYEKIVTSINDEKTIVLDTISSEQILTTDKN